MFSDVTVSQATRCGLAVIAYGATAVLVVNGQPITPEWAVLVGAISGFYFGMANPRNEGE